MNQPDKLSRILLKEYQRLKQKKYRQATGLFLCEGVHLTDEAISAEWPVEVVLVTERFLEHPPSASLLSKIREHVIPMALCSERDLASLSDTVTAQGVVAVLRQPTYPAARKTDFGRRDPLFVALDGVADPGNLGTILRTCDWFGIDGVLLGGSTVELFNPKVLRAGMGALFHLRAEIVDDLDTTLRGIRKEYRARVLVTGLSGGRSPHRDLFQGPAVVVFGNEAHGVSPEIQSLADDVITIPRFGRAESLNVAISCGVVLAIARFGT